jgi:hypothetical protein
VKKILKVGLSRSVPESGLFSILERCFPVDFARDDDFGKSDCVASIVVGHDMETAHLLSAERHTYVLSRQQDQPASPEITKVQVRFSDSRHAPWPFRNRTFDNSFSSPPCPIIPRSGYEAISSVDGACIWAIDKTAGHYRYEVGTALPHIPEGGPLFKWFKGHNFIELLPLVDFLRNITGVSEYRPPRQTACVMIDDPNLHCPGYGFIKFKEIAEHARSNNYHVAFAAIPLDLYYANKEAVGIFRTAHEQLSLLIHGNNHLANELGRDYDHGQRISLISHALARVGKFEKRTGIPISRVMAAPHGTCSESMLEAMSECGIEGGSISFGSLFKANRGKGWVTPMGLDPSTIVSGLPVFSRIHLSMDHTNEIFLAAYLNQPIIPNGHHWDLKDRYEMLRAQVEVINGLTDVRWGSMQDIVGMNYLAKTDGDELKVKILSRRIILTVPPGINRVRLETSELTGPDGLSGSSYAINSNNLMAIPSESAIYASPGDNITFLCPNRNSVDLSQIPLPRTPIKAILRRIATESVDRARPFSYRFLSSLGKTRG